MPAGLTVLSVGYPFAPVSPDAVGGAEQILARLDRAVAASGGRSLVIAPEGSKVAGELLPVPAAVGRIDERQRRRVHGCVRAILAEAVARAQPDVVHMHGVDFAAYLPPPGAPVLVTLHLPIDWYEPWALARPRPQIWFNAVSQHQARTARGRLALAAVIENGVDLPPARPRPSKRSYALALGRICPEKGFEDALEAARRADAPLILAGEVFPYPEHQAYFAREIAPRLDDRRRWIGPVGGARKRRLLQAARCLVAPSRAAETASLVAREALAAGTPVVAYPSGALADVVTDGETGLLVTDVEGLAQAMTRAGGLSSAACRAEAERRFAVDRMVQNYLELYRRISQDSREPRRRLAG